MPKKSAIRFTAQSSLDAFDFLGFQIRCRDQIEERARHRSIKLLRGRHLETLAVMPPDLPAVAETVQCAKAFQQGLILAHTRLFGMNAILLSWRDTGFASGAVPGSFRLILLYVKGPIDQLIGALPVIHRAQIAFDRIADLSQRFRTAEPDLLKPRHGQSTTTFVGRVSLRGASYRFTGDGPDHLHHRR